MKKLILVLTVFFCVSILAYAQNHDSAAASTSLADLGTPHLKSNLQYQTTDSPASTCVCGGLAGCSVNCSGSKGSATCSCGVLSSTCGCTIPGKHDVTIAVDEEGISDFQNNIAVLLVSTTGKNASILVAELPAAARSYNLGKPLEYEALHKNLEKTLTQLPQTEKDFVNKWIAKKGWSNFIK